jgi:hypothetical protein
MRPSAETWWVVWFTGGYKTDPETTRFNSPVPLSPHLPEYNVEPRTAAHRKSLLSWKLHSDDTHFRIGIGTKVLIGYLEPL